VCNAQNQTILNITGVLVKGQEVEMTQPDGKLVATVLCHTPRNRWLRKAPIVGEYIAKDNYSIACIPSVDLGFIVSVVIALDELHEGYDGAAAVVAKVAIGAANPLNYTGAGAVIGELAMDATGGLLADGVALVVPEAIADVVGIQGEQKVGRLVRTTMVLDNCTVGCWASAV